MKYAIHYYKGCPILDKADEIIIKYTERDEELINFVQKFRDDQRIVVDTSELDDDLTTNIKIFKAAATAHKNFLVLCWMEDYYQELAEANIPYAFVEGATTFDGFISQMERGVSDILVANELGFFLPELKKELGNEINIRILPNVAQSSSNFFTNSIRKFFVRPEDLELYEDCVDIVQFAGDLEKQPTFYKIYKSGKWNGELDTLIIDLNVRIPAKAVVPAFGQSRLNCKKKCTFNKCHLCDHVKLVAESFEEEGVLIIKERR